MMIKEVLNRHLLCYENENFFIEELKEQKIEKNIFYFSEKLNESVSSQKIKFLMLLDNQRFDESLIFQKKEENKTSLEVFLDVKNYLKKYLDLKEHHYTLLSLFVFQTWLQEYLDSVFYVQLKAKFGGGKTTTGQTVIDICKNGFSTADTSVALLARLIDQTEAPVFIDEIDQTKTEDKGDLFRILRVGQRREGDIYARMEGTEEVKLFHVFSSKIFAVYSELEEALSQRSLVVNITPSNDPKYPLRHRKRKQDVIDLYNELIAWKFSEEGAEAIERLINFEMEWDEEQQKMNYLHAWMQPAVELAELMIKKYKILGRNLELLENVLRISTALGITDLIAEDIIAIFLEKKEEDEAQQDRDEKIILRDLLRSIYRKILNIVVQQQLYSEDFQNLEYTDFLTKKGNIMFPLETIKQLYRRKLREENIFLNERKITGLFNDLGLRDFIVKKKMKKITVDEYGRWTGEGKKTARRVLVFTKDVQRAIGIDPEEMFIEGKLGGVENE